MLTVASAADNAAAVARAAAAAAAAVADADAAAAVASEGADAAASEGAAADAPRGVDDAGYESYDDYVNDPNHPAYYQVDCGDESDEDFVDACRRSNMYGSLSEAERRLRRIAEVRGERVLGDAVEATPRQQPVQVDVEEAAEEDDDVEGQVRRRHRTRLEENAPLAGHQDGEGEERRLGGMTFTLSGREVSFFAVNSSFGGS